jgi:adenosylhomocysteine nucleosidase
VTILVPRGAEAAAVRRALPHARIVELAAGAAAAAALPVFADGEAVVVLGLCGALRGYAVGDVVVYREIVTARSVFVCDPVLSRAVARALGAAPVRACTVDHVVTTIAERSALAAALDADVVDMEGAYLADALQRRTMPYAMLRVVSDDAAHDLPSFERVITAGGGFDAFAFVLASLRSPRAAVRFIRSARRALDRLSEAAKRLESAAR